jgi:hypothetical protein
MGHPPIVCMNRRVGNRPPGEKSGSGSLSWVVDAPQMFSPMSSPTSASSDLLTVKRMRSRPDQTGEGAARLSW